MNKPTRTLLALVAVFGIAGCGAMDSVQSFEMRREADGAAHHVGKRLPLLL